MACFSILYALYMYLCVFLCVGVCVGVCLEVSSVPDNCELFRYILSFFSIICICSRNTIHDNNIEPSSSCLVCRQMLLPTTYIRYTCMRYHLHACVCVWERILLRAMLTFNVCIYVFLHIPFCYSVNCITMGFFPSLHISSFFFVFAALLSLSHSLAHSFHFSNIFYIIHMWPKLQYFA